MTLEIDSTLEKSFEKYSNLFGIDKEQFIKEALLEKLENLEDLKIATERLEKPAKRYSMKEIDDEITLED